LRGILRQSQPLTDQPGAARVVPVDPFVDVKLAVGDGGIVCLLRLGLGVGIDCDEHHVSHSGLLGSVGCRTRGRRTGHAESDTTEPFTRQI